MKPPKSNTVVTANGIKDDQIDLSKIPSFDAAFNGSDYQLTLCKVKAFDDTYHEILIYQKFSVENI